MAGRRGGGIIGPSPRVQLPAARSRGSRRYTMQAIETNYKGYRFRSRLEARWAVFFDSLYVPYEYEQQGFELKSGVRYLPDFWLPTWKMWVEIKPVPPDGKELHKLNSFADECSDDLRRSLYLIVGNPWPREHIVEDLRHGITYGLFMECRKCNGVYLGEMEGEELVGFCTIGPHTCGDHDKWPSSACEKAYKAARSARFEYGETPRATRKNPYERPMTDAMRSFFFE